MPDDVRITKPEAGTIPTVETLVPPAAVVEAAPVVVAEAPIEAAPVAAVVEEMPTAEPTLFEKFEQRQADKGKIEAEKPAAEVVVEAEVKTEEKPAEKVEEKPAEGEKPIPDAAKPAVEEVKVEAVEPKPIAWEYQLPENVALPEKQAGELHTALSNFAANPTDKTAQQSLVDFHFERLHDSILDYNRQSHKAFADKRAEWQKLVENHPEIGGGNHDAAMQAIAYVRDNYLSSHPRGSKQYEAARKGLDEWMHLTGAGDNPHFLEMMHNVAQVLAEPKMEATQEIRPIVQQENGGRAAIYKHPTSFSRR